MFSRTKSLFKVSVFKSVIRNCQNFSALENFLRPISESPPKQGYSLVFFDDEVQKLLKKISNVSLERVFKKHPKGEPLEPPEYKLLTTEELQEELNKAHKKAEELLQIPPLINITEYKTEILDSDTSLDGHDMHHSKHVFIDLSFNKTNEARAIVVREPNGVLRTANKSERFRLNQIYNPMPGREIETPLMFLFENLLGVIKRKDYEFILDRACIQFEPDETLYHQTITLTYEAINFCGDFEKLHSTRHFGSLAFYLITHKNMDNLLNFNIENDRIEDAFSLVKLYHIIHPKCKSAEISSGKSEMDVLKDFIEFDSNYKDALSRNLDTYIRKQERQKEAEVKLKEAHGF